MTQTTSILTYLFGSGPTSIIITMLTPDNSGTRSLCLYNGINELCVNITNINLGLMGACRGGHLTLAKVMIGRGATNVNFGLIGSCRGGHLDLAKLMLNLGATDFNAGLRSACINNQVTLAKLMLYHGATNGNQCLRLIITSEIRATLTTTDNVMD